MKIKDIRVIVGSPGRNFVTVKIITDEGLDGIGDATLNGRELAVAAYLSEHVAPTLIGARPVPDRGHLAIPLPRRLLAARAGDHGRDRRHRHGPVGHQGQGGRMPLYQLLGGASRDRVMCYSHAQGRDIEEAVEAVGRRTRGRATTPSRAGRHPRPARRLRHRASTRSPTTPPTSNVRRTRRSGPRAKYLPLMRQSSSRRSATPHGWTCTSSTTSTTGSPPSRPRGWARILSPSACSGWRTRRGRAPGRLPPDPPAHHHAARGGRGVQHDLGLPSC